MNKELSNFDENELSDEDLAVLRAFEAMDDWPEEISSDTSLLDTTEPFLPLNATQESFESSSVDMIELFLIEVEEDAAIMRRMLNQLEQEAHINPKSFVMFRRLGHKIRGSAGVVEYHAIARIAQYIEETAEQIVQGIIFPIIGVNALTHAISALEATLQSISMGDEEYTIPLIELEQELNDLLGDRISEQATHIAKQPTSEIKEHYPPTSNKVENIPSPVAWAQVDARRLEQLQCQSEQLTELRIPLESAQAEVDNAIQQLHAAQARLIQLEPTLFSLLISTRLLPLTDDLPGSSLMARILSEAEQRNDTARTSRRNRPRSRLAQATETAMWDELDVERYTEQDLLLNALREAIADLNAASSRVHIAFEHLRLMTRDYTNQATTMRHNVALLCLVPLSTLVPLLQEVIATTAAVQGQHVQFEVVGDTIEIDQQILNALTLPLLHVLETCTTDTSLSHTTAQQPARVWLHAHKIGNEITIEIGFSVVVNGGAVEALHEVIQRLNGTLLLQRNNAGGVSFLLRLPRSQGATHCLLVRVNDQQVIVPFSQIQRIGDGKQEHFDKLYYLSDLLTCPIKAVFTGRIQPVLVLLQGPSPVSVAVIIDEVVGEGEFVLKPLPSYLRRPGITSAAIDGKGHALLMLDLPELVRHYTQRLHNAGKQHPASTAQLSRQSLPKVLLADDSVYLRNTLVQILKHAHYAVLEASDGLEALEQLIHHMPDVFLLDVEMPNLNGYDLLGIMRLYPSLAGVKIIMLTSRSSEKHMQHALDLGAHAYLTKPCSQEILIETIQKMLRD